MTTIELCVHQETHSQNSQFILTLHYKKGHQVSNLGDHSFGLLNTSIKKKPIFFSPVVIFKKYENGLSRFVLGLCSTILVRSSDEISAPIEISTTHTIPASFRPFSPDHIQGKKQTSLPIRSFFRQNRAKAHPFS